MKNLEEVTYGYYGTTWFCRLCGRAVLKRVRTRERNELHLLTPGGSFCIFIAPLSAKFRGADCQNEAAILAADRIFELLARVRAEGRRVFLYVLDSLHRTGGVERRTELLFDWLLRHGVQPVLLCSQQGYTPLEHIPTISFLPYAPHAEEALIKLIELTGAEVVEFQLKSPKLLHSINLNRLKSQARIGCTVHSRVRVQQEVLDQLDFRATPNQAKELKNFVMIPNVVAFPEVVPQYRVGPRKAWKALYVGRLDKVKLTTIRT